jgi:ABC-type lipoprotein export system ATPase subunit
LIIAIGGRHVVGWGKKRLAAARTLINNRGSSGRWPTAALDQANKIAIMNLFCQMKEQRLVVVVSHEKELLEQYADTIYRLQDGIKSILSTG